MNQMFFFACCFIGSQIGKSNKNNKIMPYFLKKKYNTVLPLNKI